MPSPNGVALSPDERVLYLGVTRGNQVWRVPLLPDGSVSKVSAFFTSYGPSGPDGLAVDEAGRVLVANPGLGLVWVLNHRGEPETVLRATLETAGGPVHRGRHGVPVVPRETKKSPAEAGLESIPAEQAPRRQLFQNISSPCSDGD